MIAILSVLVALVLLIAAFFVIHGRERTWALLTGPNDPGSYDFSAAARRPTGNDALACSPGMCARPDWTLPEYHVGPAVLISRLAATLEAGDRLARRVDDGSDADYARFVTFSPVMRFPDAIDMRAAALPDGATGVEIYARAKLGRSDFGKNRKRIEHLMAGFQP